MTWARTGAWAVAGLGVLVAVVVAAWVYWFASVAGALSGPGSAAPPSVGEGGMSKQPVVVPPTYHQPDGIQPDSVRPDIGQPLVEQATLPVSEQPEQKAQLLPPPMPGTWEATPISGRSRALGRAGVDLEQGLQDLQADISNCFSKPGQSGYKGRRVLEVARPEIADTGSTVVVLQVEADRGVLRVNEAPVEVRAGASDATIACVQDKLRNVRVPSDAQPPAYRFRLRYTVTP